jgi:hypothetical protein
MLWPDKPADWRSFSIKPAQRGGCYDTAHVCPECIDAT